MSRYAQYSHGPLLGFIASWANWISLITLIPIEAVAAVQYMSSWPWAWANWTHSFLKGGTITTSGLMIVFMFILVFTLLNFWSVKLLTSFTSLISILKIGVPALTIIMLTVSGFYPQIMAIPFMNLCHTDQHLFLPPHLQPESFSRLTRSRL